MNELIQKLAEEAGFRSNPDIYDRNQSFDIPKFAELIVKECANRLVDMDQQVKGQHNYYKHASIQVMLHFGVQP
jgi:hypothetical protein